MLSPAASSAATCCRHPPAPRANSQYSGLFVGCRAVAICRSSARECRQGYATTLLSSVKRQASAASRIILSYRHRGRGRARRGGRTPRVGSRPAAMTAECCRLLEASPTARELPHALRGHRLSGRHAGRHRRHAELAPSPVRSVARLPRRRRCHRPARPPATRSRPGRS